MFMCFKMIFDVDILVNENRTGYSIYSQTYYKILSVSNYPIALIVQKRDVSCR